MPSEMRRPEIPNIDRFINRLDERLRLEAVHISRAVPPWGVTSLLHKMRKLIKPLAQSGAMAMTALAVIIAIGATPAATTGDLATPRSTPLAAPNETALVQSDRNFIDYLPADDILALTAIQEADISDTSIFEPE